ncbi:MAG TPA: hypothetical protein VGM05_30325 [Planctomycetaceae bacterium]|jgi:hypothetical protein
MNSTTATIATLSKSQEEALLELAYYGLGGDYEQHALRELVQLGLVKIGRGRDRGELTDEGRRLHHELRN